MNKKYCSDTSSVSGFAVLESYCCSEIDKFDNFGLFVIHHILWF